MLKSLFYCHLSGTEALPQQRSQFVHELISSGDEVHQSIGLSLLDAGLEAWHFSSHYDFDFGARKRGFGWWPKNRKDVQNWFGGFIDIAVSLGQSKSPSNQRALRILSESLRGIWVAARLEEEIQSAVSRLTIAGGWPEGWLGIRQILKYDKDKLSEASWEKLLQLEKLMRPHDLRERIYAKVLARGTLADDFDEDVDDTQSFSDLLRRTEAEAEELGHAAARDEALLHELIPDLLTVNTNSKIVNFGIGVGHELIAPMLLLAKLKNYLQTDAIDRFSTSFIRGVILGMNKSNADHAENFLDTALNDDFWSKYFPELQTLLPLDERAVARLLKSIELNKAPSWQYRCLGFGRANDPLTIAQVKNLVFSISQISNGGIATAVDVLGMVVHCAREKDENYREELAKASLAFLKNLDWRKIDQENERLEHDIDVILRFTLSYSHTESEVKTVLLNLVRHSESDSHGYSRRYGKRFAGFFEYYPTQTLNAIYRVNDDDLMEKAWRRLADWDDERGETAIRKVPLDALISWCKESPADRFIFAARTCRLFEKPAEESSLDVAVSDTAIQVLSYAPDKAAVLEIFIERFSPRAWSGSLSAILSARLPLLAVLNPLHDAELKPLIEKAETELRQKIKHWGDIEAADERRETGSFE